MSDCKNCQDKDALIANLAMLVRRLAWTTRKDFPDITKQALDYLKEHELMAGPLRNNTNHK